MSWAAAQSASSTSEVISRNLIATSVEPDVLATFSYPTNRVFVSVLDTLSPR